MKKQATSIFIFILSMTMINNTLLSDEVAEGFFGGGFLGATIGGAAGGGRGAAIGGAVGSTLGATMGAAARSSRERKYYDHQNMIYAQNDDLRYENKWLIREYKQLFQKKARYEWMLAQCQRGIKGYKKRAQDLYFKDHTDYRPFLYWQNESYIRRQNRKLMKSNNRLKYKINQLQEDINMLKRQLKKCEKEW